MGRGLEHGALKVGGKEAKPLYTRHSEWIMFISLLKDTERNSRKIYGE